MLSILSIDVGTKVSVGFEHAASETRKRIIKYLFIGCIGSSADHRSGASVRPGTTVPMAYIGTVVGIAHDGQAPKGGVGTTLQGHVQSSLFGRTLGSRFHRFGKGFALRKCLEVGQLFLGGALAVEEEFFGAVGWLHSRIVLPVQAVALVPFLCPVRLNDRRFPIAVKSTVYQPHLGAVRLAQCRTVVPVHHAFFVPFFRAIVGDHDRTIEPVQMPAFKPFLLIVRTDQGRSVGAMAHSVHKPPLGAIRSLKHRTVVPMTHSLVIRTSFCKNLHAKCYMNEEMCIITSLNLYEFSQVNNNEMGILIQRSEDGQLYKDAYEEAQRIIRISDEVRISLERVTSDSDANGKDNDKSATDAPTDKLTSSKIGQKLGLKTAQFLDRATELGYLAADGDNHTITPKGEKAGVEFVAKSRFGPYFLWPQDFHLV